jgi:hypothetical protein
LRDEFSLFKVSLIIPLLSSSSSSFCSEETAALRPSHRIASHRDAYLLKVGVHITVSSTGWKKVLQYPRHASSVHLMGI